MDETTDYNRLYQITIDGFAYQFVEISRDGMIYGCDDGQIEADWTGEPPVAPSYGWGNGGPQLEWDWGEHHPEDNYIPWKDGGELLPGWDVIDDPAKVREFMSLRMIDIDYWRHPAE